MNRTRVLIILGIVLLAAVLVKSVTVLISERSFHAYRVTQAQARDKGFTLQAAHIAIQIQQLHEAIRWAPENGAVHFEMGRVLHRLASENDMENMTQTCGASGIEPDACNAMSLLIRALDHYDRAVQANRLVGGARFWRLAAGIAFQDRAREAGMDVPEPMSDQALLEALQSEIVLEGNNPSLFYHASDLAYRAGDESLAAEYLARALHMSLEKLEQVVERVIVWKEGVAVLDRIVPKQPTAQRRLSQALARQWHFREAKDHWDQAMALENRTLTDPEPGNLVTNGRFFDPLGSHFLGWDLQPTEGVVFERSDGSPGFTVKLNHSPSTFFHLTQAVQVESQTTYRFTAKIKVEGGHLRRRSSFGFEVIHPFDFSIWSAQARCEILQTGNRPSCEGQTMDEDGFFTLQFDFTPPHPLRVVILRMTWSGRPYRGRLFVDHVRIEPVAMPEGAANVPTP